MKEFAYKIKDSVGIHARPAGLLVKKAAEFKSDITVLNGEKSADAKKIFSVMALGAKCGDKIVVKINGADEELAVAEMKTFFEESL